jgi:hypothetical protein
MRAQEKRPIWLLYSLTCLQILAEFSSVDWKNGLIFRAGSYN